MITIGSISREKASEDFPFLAQHYRGRRKAIKNFTHLAPDYVFWIYPDGDLFDAKDSHKNNTPKGFQHILLDEPDYSGFLRGRVASNYGPQIIVVYCREEALASDLLKIRQFLNGVAQLPIPLQQNTLVVSDNADIYGTLTDIRQRASIVG
ncbi:hypothetical protein O5O45_27065 [Hahella aquimaris]|uniref:hypothetical protein n=1 Tax=Hahella sp. HNIBRBA332 TaxID=3015983 RepID=UPI00273C3306|nr:hypothetical protein [Hahella sp. HNIBRBA332]WLQ13390.1 hypothetical protein O5O45_27065 [Hahella sp. HNIBRBA332]